MFWRIIGAIIIIGGLYLVVWGKSKDHKSQSPSTDEHLPPAEQTNNTGSNGKENFGHEVAKIDVWWEELLLVNDNNNAK